MKKEIYLNTLKNTFIDKAFFIEKLPQCVTRIVDFGCADGSFLNFIKKIYGNRFEYIGIECDDYFRTISKHNGITTYPSIEEYIHYNSSSVVGCNNTRIVNKNINTCLNFSSSLHEVFHYDKNYASTLFDIIFNKFKPLYITIRDMNIKDYYNIYNITDLDTINTKNNLILKLINKFVQHESKKFVDFEKIYPIHNLKDCIHFLLKYFYDDNWERESKENYLSFDLDTIIKADKSGLYNTLWELDYNLPYLFRKWTIDDMIVRPDLIRKYITTHTQIIYERKD